MLEIRGMQNTPLLPSVPGSLWPGVVAPERVLLMDQTFWHLNNVFMLNWIVWNKTVFIFNCVNKKTVCLCWTELFEIELFDNLTMHEQMTDV